MAPKAVFNELKLKDYQIEKVYAKDRCERDSRKVEVRSFLSISHFSSLRRLVSVFHCISLYVVTSIIIFQGKAITIIIFRISPKYLRNRRKSLTEIAWYGSASFIVVTLWTLSKRT